MSTAVRPYQTVNPTNNKYLDRRWDQDIFNNHRKKVASAKSVIDNNPPRVHLHMHIKLKKLQFEAERLATIERDNRILLEKIAHIMRTGGRVDHNNLDHTKKSLNKPKRQRELLRISHENLAILKRLQTKDPHYNHKKWLLQWQVNQQYHVNISKYPHDWREVQSPYLAALDRQFAANKLISRKIRSASHNKTSYTSFFSTKHEGGHRLSRLEQGLDLLAQLRPKDLSAVSNDTFPETPDTVPETPETISETSDYTTDTSDYTMETLDTTQEIPTTPERHNTTPERHNATPETPDVPELETATYSESDISSKKSLKLELKTAEVELKQSFMTIDAGMWQEVKPSGYGRRDTGIPALDIQNEDEYFIKVTSMDHSEAIEEAEEEAEEAEDEVQELETSTYSESDISSKKSSKLELKTAEAELKQSCMRIDADMWQEVKPSGSGRRDIAIPALDIQNENEYFIKVTSMDHSEAIEEAEEEAEEGEDEVQELKTSTDSESDISSKKSSKLELKTAEAELKQSCMRIDAGMWQEVKPSGSDRRDIGIPALDIQNEDEYFIKVTSMDHSEAIEEAEEEAEEAEDKDEEESIKSLEVTSVVSEDLDFYGE